MSLPACRQWASASEGTPENGPFPSPPQAVAPSAEMRSPPTVPSVPPAAPEAPSAPPRAPAAAELERFPFRDLGEIEVQPPSEAPRHVVIVVWDGVGLDRAVRATAADLRSRGALVVLASTPRVLAHLNRTGARCAYPAADFMNVSNYVQMKLGVAEHIDPVLVGIGSGASLVWAAVAQAPAHLFKALVTLGFCPRLALARPLCRGDGLKLEVHGATQSFRPSQAVAIPWRALQGGADSACPVAAIEPFVRAAAQGELTTIAGLTHDLEGASWADRVAEVATSAGARPAAPPPEPVSDLPLVEVPAAGATGDQGHELAVIISGDGGWADIDRQLAHVLAQNGVATVGLNALRYYWHRHDAESSAHDLARVLRYYGTHWHRQHFVLIGYSRGADVLAPVFNRLPPELKAQTTLVVLIGPSHTVSYEFHMSEWIGGPAGPTEPTQPEIDKLQGTPILCVYGVKEDDTACPSSKGGNVERFAMPGGHHFNGDYKTIARRILEELARLTAAGKP